MYGEAAVSGLYPKGGPFFCDDIIDCPDFQVFLMQCTKSILFSETWNENELEKPSSQRRDMAFYLLTETSMKDDLIVDFPNGNLILREDYQKSFKKEVRVKDMKKFLQRYHIYCRRHVETQVQNLFVRENIGSHYPSYTNAEKDWLVCRPSRERDVHDGYDRKVQCVKAVNV